MANSPGKSLEALAVEEMDEKAEIEVRSERVATPVIDPQAEARLVRKLDFVLLPLFTAICESPFSLSAVPPSTSLIGDLDCCNFIDRCVAARSCILRTPTADPREITGRR